MNTSHEALKHLRQALAETRTAAGVIDNLLVEHDYQDVASIVTQAAAALLDTAALLMESQDEAALDALETAEDLLDSAYAIIDSETEDE